MSTTLDASTVDLMAVLAYGELSAFERVASDARLAPTLHDKATLAGIASASYAHFVSLRDHLAAHGVDPEQAMAPFVEALDRFHDSTQPNDWYEGLVKVYVGDGLAKDFYREVSSALPDAATRELILEVLADTAHATYAVARVTAAIADQPRLGGRLALWGRRLVGEALIQAQRVAVDRDALTELLVDQDLAGVLGLLNRLTDAHTARMAALGLES